MRAVRYWRVAGTTVVVAAIVATIASLAARSGARAQTQERPPTFRGGATFVYVDVYPRRDGRVLEGLTAAEFQVFEDGKPQKVELFEFLKAETVVPDADRRDPTSAADSERQAADRRNRVFVLYLDPYHTTRDGAYFARDPIREFLTRTLNATDLFGVMVPDKLVSSLVFGRRTETAEAELVNGGNWGMAEEGSAGHPVVPRSDMERRLLTCDPDGQLVLMHREDKLFTSLENLMERLQHLKDERKNVIFVSQGLRLRRPNPSALSRTTGDIPQIGVGPTGRLGRGSQQPWSRDNAWCDAQLGYLAMIDYQRRYQDLLTRAREANVSFYPIDVAGLTVDNRSRAVASLQTLAENTDGLAIANTNDLKGGMRRITDSVSAYYLLGYYSTNLSADGRYRRIEVKVKQPRVSIAARHGYLAPTAAMASAAAAPAVSAPPSAIEVELRRLSRLRPGGELFAYGVATDAGLTVVAELESALAERSGWRDGGDVRVVITSPGRPERVASARIEPGARSVSIAIPHDSSDHGGPWRVAVEASGASGVLEDAVEIAPPKPSGLGDPLVFRATASPRAPLRPVAEIQFRRTERLRVEWPRLATAAEVEARVLDRAGRALASGIPVAQREDGDRRYVVVDLAMSPFAEGDYVLELTIGAQMEAEVERKLLAFRVVR